MPAVDSFRCCPGSTGAGARDHRRHGRARGRLSINSDAPAYFGGYFGENIGENYVATAEELALTREEIARIAQNSFDAGFSYR